jgi:hypothetical protein
LTLGAFTARGDKAGISLSHGQDHPEGPYCYKAVRTLLVHPPTVLWRIPLQPRPPPREIEITVTPPIEQQPIGRRQELFYDNGEPIQSSAGSMRDLSRPAGIEENGLSLYKGLNRTNHMPGRLLSTNRTLNPIDRLPPELAASFIRNALSLHDRLHPEFGRPSRLIELSTVSKKWQSFLVSTAILWSNLIIDEEQEDFLATLSVFVALSSKIPLKLTFRKEPVDWARLAPLLVPVTQRITSLNFEGHDDLEISWIYSVIPTVFRRLGHLPRLKEVNFDVMNTGVGLLQIESLLPSTVKLTGISRSKCLKAAGIVQLPSDSSTTTYIISLPLWNLSHHRLTRLTCDTQSPIEPPYILMTPHYHSLGI